MTEREPPGPAGPEGLQGGLFGRKTGRQGLDPVGPAGAIGPLGGAEQALLDPFPVAGEGPLEPRELDHVFGIAHPRAPPQRGEGVHQHPLSGARLAVEVQRGDRAIDIAGVRYPIA